MKYGSVIAPKREPNREPYRVIISDPPWEFRRKDKKSCAGNHYKTLSIDDLRNLEVQEIAAPDSLLYLWAPFTHLPEALRLIDAWGFRYMTGLPWVKIYHKRDERIDVEPIRPQYGLGAWFRGCAELVLLGVRGKVRPPESQFSGIISQNFGHSRKPDNLHDVARNHDGPRLEMFARRTEQPGFDFMGIELLNEAEPFRVLDNGATVWRNIGAASGRIAGDV